MFSRADTRRCCQTGETLPPSPSALLYLFLISFSQLSTRPSPSFFCHAAESSFVSLSLSISASHRPIPPSHCSSLSNFCLASEKGKKWVLLAASTLSFALSFSLSLSLSLLTPVFAASEQRSEPRHSAAHKQCAKVGH